MEKKRANLIGLASDHAGYEMKEALIKWLKKSNLQVIDFGCNNSESCDYPDFAHPLARSVADGACVFGISLCGSGNGINMVVNKYPGIRSALCWNEEISKLARAHNNANICALPARFISIEEAKTIVKIFLETPFDGGRHLRRINKIPLQ